MLNSVSLKKQKRRRTTVKDGVYYKHLSLYVETIGRYNGLYWFQFLTST